MKKHTKHTDLTRPEIGNFAKNEVALVGAPCGIIKDLALELRKNIALSKVAYVDADHGAEQSLPPVWNEVTDKINFFRYDSAHTNEWDHKSYLRNEDLVIVNGNHFQAQKQIVLIHPAKESSLLKRKEQLSHVLCVVLCEGADMPFSWLIELFPNVPVLKQNEVAKMAQFVEAELKTTKVKGLILAGGQSTRMGQDKGQIAYHGLPQVEFLRTQFDRLQVEHYVSCREEQYTELPRIQDSFNGLGPFGAILSAFRKEPDTAWLVVACDLPLLDASHLNELLSQRDASKIATAFFNEATGFVDPLCTLWEPKSYPRLLNFLSFGYSCPRKVLINSDVHVIHPSSQDILINANTPEERLQIEKSIA